jgi:hypothetical protein
MRRPLLLACLSLASAVTAAAAPPEDSVDASAASRKVNLSVDPFAPFFGLFDGAGAYAVSPHAAVAGSIGYFSMGSPGWGWNAFQVAGSVPLYLQRTFSGPFAEPGVIYRSVDRRAIDSGSNYGYHETWVGPQLLLGWHWNFDSGLNIALAAGVAQHWGGTHRNAMGMESPVSSDDPDFNGYLRAGYNF